MKKVFLTEKGPKAVGPYSTAAIHGDTAYLSGMIPMDPAAGKIVEGGITEQSRQVFENIKTVLDEMGLSLADALKVTVFLTDMADFAPMNEIYKEYFGPAFPARSCVAVHQLPMGVKVEAEVVAAAK